MDQIGVVGLSYRHAAAEDIAGFTLPKDGIHARLPALRAALQAEELVYLATCNRVEIAFATPEGAAAHDCRDQIFRVLSGREPQAGEARATLRAWTGEAAVEHLFLLACGLDSAQAGEREIATQLRAAWETARAAGVCGSTLDHVFGEALATSNRVSRLAAGARAPSLADLAVDRMLQHLRSQAGTVALIGVSAMTRRCGELLRQAGVPLVVVNRSIDAAGELAQSLSVPASSLEAFKQNPPDISGLILATGGSEPLLDEAALAKVVRTASRKPLIVDFGLPPNVDPVVSRRCGLTRIGMDELIQAAQEQRTSQLMRLAPVRSAVDERLAWLRGQLAARAIGKQLAELRDTFEQIAGAELERLLAEELQGLTAQQKERLHRFTTTIARRLAHLPLAGMRAAAAHASAEMVNAFFYGARLQRDSALKLKRERHDGS